MFGVSWWKKIGLRGGTRNNVDVGLVLQDCVF